MSRFSNGIEAECRATIACNKSRLGPFASVRPIRRQYRSRSSVSFAMGKHLIKRATRSDIRYSTQVWPACEDRSLGLLAIKQRNSLTDDQATADIPRLSGPAGAASLHWNRVVLPHADCAADG